MRAAVLNSGSILVRDDVADPTPGFGQVLVQVKACGICGSDLHFAKHGGDMLALGKQIEGMPDLGEREEVELDRDVFKGHEFAAEVLDVGPDTQSAAPLGSLVTSIPVLLGMDGIKPIVYSNPVLGGYAERMLLSAPMLLEVPNGLSAEHAALTEPMAVGLHAVDPREETGWSAWSRTGSGRPPVVFEAIGVPGILNDILRSAPAQSRVVVVGVCMEADTVNPFFGISKELNIQFVLGYDPMEFAGSLRSIAEGGIDVSPMITAHVDLDGVPQAFEDLGNPDEHCKILVTP